MNEDTCVKLEQVLARHGHGLFANPRAAEIIRENLGSGCKLEASLLNAAVQLGIPQRLHATHPKMITRRMLANLAADLSSASGVKQELSVWTVEVWAKALGCVIEQTGLESFAQPVREQQLNKGMAIKENTQSSGKTVRRLSRWLAKASEDRPPVALPFRAFVLCGLVLAIVTAVTSAIYAASVGMKPAYQSYGDLFIQLAKPTLFMLMVETMYFSSFLYLFSRVLQRSEGRALVAIIVVIGRFFLSYVFWWTFLHAYHLPSALTAQNIVIALATEVPALLLSLKMCFLIWSPGSSEGQGSAMRLRS
jgi:hypothetical protein